MSSEPLPSDGPLLSMEVRPVERGVVVDVAGEVDMLTTPELRAGLVEQLERVPERLVVDMSRVRFLGSSGLAVLVEALETARRTGTALSLVAGSRSVLRPLRSTGLAELFATHPDLDAALAAG